MPTTQINRLFSGVYPGGIVYADRTRQKHGDYARAAFLPFDSLELKFEDDCPAELKEQITTDAAAIQARRGEQFQISTAGQFITLGYSTLA